MSIFNIDQILTESESIKNDVLISPTINTSNDCSYFIESVEFAAEQKREFQQASMTLYRSIAESAGREEIITESFEEFFSKVKQIIDKFIKFIKSLFARFITAFNAAIKSDKYLIKHKKDFDDFKDTMNLYMDIYNFTFNTNVPSSSVIDVWVAETDLVTSLFNGTINQSNNTQILYTPESIESTVKDLYNRIKDQADDDYDLFRAKVLNRTPGEKIYSEDYANELFEEFRDGYSETSSEQITSSKIREYFKRFENYSKTESQLNKEKTNLEKSYERAKKEVEKSTFGIVTKDGNSHITINNTTIHLTQAANNTAQEIAKFLANQILEFSNIHAMAYSAKLDALKACYNQDKRVLYKALSKIQKGE